MRCRICETTTKSLFTNLLLNKYHVNYFHCPLCGYLQTEFPYWIEDAYKDSYPSADTGACSRNLLISHQLGELLQLLDINSDNLCIDYAGGVGMLTRLMRDQGYNFRWADKYASNHFAQGFEYNDQSKGSLITAVEVFEHFVSPMNEIEQLFKIADTLVFSTETLPDDIPAPDSWWYYAPEGGQHIGFYQNKTFLYLANKYNKCYIEYKSLKIFLSKTNKDKIVQAITLREAFFQKLLRKIGCKLLQRATKQPLSLPSKVWEDHLYINSIK